MLRSAAGKVMWVGRATVFIVGVAVILALVLGAATTALGATGGNFILGKPNTANSMSSLVANITDPLKPTQAALMIQQKSGGPALDLRVNAGKAPMKINSGTQVTNLNTDKLDGKDSSDFLPADGTLPSATTLRGNFEIDADADEDTSTTLGTHSVASNAISFGFALTSAPVAHTIDVNATPPPECPGTASSPEAAPGHLCIYESYEENERDPGWNFYPNTLHTTRYGTGLYTQSQSAGKFFVSRGTWAVTAP